MKVTRFDPSGELIIVPAFVTGSGGLRARLEMVLDTGAALTVVDPGILDRLGYSPRHGEARTQPPGPGGRIEARVARLPHVASRLPSR